MNDFTFLNIYDIYPYGIDIMTKYGKDCSISDFAILLGGHVSETNFTNDGKSLKDRATSWWTSSTTLPTNHEEGVCYVNEGSNSTVKPNDWGLATPKTRDIVARPAFSCSSIRNIISQTRVFNSSGIAEVEYGEYPQTVVDEKLNDNLENLYKKVALVETGKQYTTDHAKKYDYEKAFTPRIFKEYEYNGSQYIRFVVDEMFDGTFIDNRLSNGKEIHHGDVFWIKVEPIRWLIDERKDIALAKKGLFAGVRFSSMGYTGDFKNTEIKFFMDKYFSQEILKHVKKVEGAKTANADETGSHVISDMTEETEQGIFRRVRH